MRTARLALIAFGIVLVFGGPGGNLAACVTPGYAVPATPIRLPSGSVKWPTTRPVGARSGPTGLPAEALGLLQGGLDVGNADVEDHLALVPGASADAAGIPVPSLW